jgi:chaperonin GroES
MLMNIRPLHDRVVVLRVDEPPQPSGAIIIPDSARDKSSRGTVVAVGAGKYTDDGERLPLDVRTGDTVLFGKHAGQELKVDGVDYLILREDEVLAEIHDATP